MVTDVLLLMFLIGYVSFCTIFHKRTISSPDDNKCDKLTEWLVSIIAGWLSVPIYLGSFLGTKLKKEMNEEAWKNDVLRKLNK